LAHAAISFKAGPKRGTKRGEAVFDLPVRLSDDRAADETVAFQLAQVLDQQRTARCVDACWVAIVNGLQGWRRTSQAKVSDDEKRWNDGGKGHHVVHASRRVDLTQRKLNGD
jgi:hypothetical protein